LTWIEMIEPHALAQLIENHRVQEPLKGGDERDFIPSVKLFTPWAGATWLLTECDPDGLAFGLCDLGSGMPELGYVSLDEVASLRGPGGIRVEQDLHFRAEKPLSWWVREARREGRITA
jgi:hypothetical protein